LDAGCTVVHLVHTEPGEGNGTGGVRKTRPGIAVHQYRPRVPYEGEKGVLDFTREQIEKAIAAGESDALSHDCAASGCTL
jgi:hypothetical protein